MFTRSVTRLTLALVIVGASLMLITSFTITAATPTADARPRADLIVNPGESIQAAIDAANDGDTILVNAGTYTESLTLSKPVSLTGVNSDTTILHAMPGQRVLTVTGATITNSVVISGLTFTGGEADNGGGILVNIGSQSTIYNTLITNNRATNKGGGIYAGSSTAFINTDFVSNSSSFHGGGVAILATSWITGGRFERNYVDRLSGFSGGGVQVGTQLPAGIGLSVNGTTFISNTAVRGGGIYVGFSSALTVTNGWFEGNQVFDPYYSSGSAVDALYSSLNFSHTVFSHNYGSAVYLYDSAINVNNSRFENNTAYYGAGLMAEGFHGAGALDDGYPAHFTDTVFLSNTSYGGSAGLSAKVQQLSIWGGRFENNLAMGHDGGGGLSAYGATTISGTHFIRNTASEAAGAWLAGSTLITNALFEQNTSTMGDGGGLSGNGSIYDTTFISNTAGRDGGGVVGVLLIAVNTKFINNTAFGNGGGLVAGCFIASNTQFIGNSASGLGGGLYHDWPYFPYDSYVTNTLFLRNHSGQAGAELYYNSTGRISILHSTIADTQLNTTSAIAIDQAFLNITDTLITNHAIGISNTGGTVTEDYNLFYGNVTNTIDVITGEHSLVGDPHFIDPAHDDYHLAFGSAAIDRGIDAGVYVDLDGNLRPQGAGFDIGAYESVIYRTFLPILLR